MCLVAVSFVLSLNFIGADCFMALIVHYSR